MPAPFLRYPGGKSKIANVILAYMPYKTEEMREAFSGGAGVFFRLDPTKVKKRWINDINSHLISVYEAFRDRPEAFIQLCRSIPRMPKKTEPQEPLIATKGTGKQYNERLGRLFKEFATNEEMDQALRYFFINRTVWAGRVNYDPKMKSRMYYSNPQGWNNIHKPGFLESVAKHLFGVRITCGDYSQLLIEPGDAVWCYCDPPYLVDTEMPKTDKQYQFGFTSKEDHIAFAKMCKKSPHKLCISYDDNPFIRELFPKKDGWFTYEHSWKYSGSSLKEKVAGKELVITNYERPGEQATLEKEYLAALKKGGGNENTDMFTEY